jgi:hypothetical protein
MKKILLAVVVILGMSQSSHANILKIDTPPCAESVYRNTVNKCLLSFTTSIPTFIIASEESMSNEEKTEFVRAEATNLLEGVTTESVLLNAIAEKTGKDVFEVAREILEAK